MKFKNTISEQKIIFIDIDWLFNFTQNIDERLKWDKQTTEIGFINDNTALEEGTGVFTKSKEGLHMETEYLSFYPPNKIAIKMINNSNLFKNFVGVWTYKSEQKKQTILQITYQFNLQFPYTLITHLVKKKIRSNIIKKLNGLKNYINES